MDCSVLLPPKNVDVSNNDVECLPNNHPDFPRYKIKKTLLVTAFLSYTFFLMTWEIIVYIFGGSGNRYWRYGWSKYDVYCWRNEDSQPLKHLDHLVRAICIGFPSIFTIVSFTIVTYLLLQKSEVYGKKRRKHQAAVTMSMFTALFLTCNLPCLLRNILYFVDLL